jgi:homocysteine S-methyltransferase
MINCAHPSHFAPLFEGSESWMHRIGGLRANASRRSHAELDASEDLDAGDPQELAEDYRRLLARLPRVTVLGGCCGTDLRHVEAIGRAALPVLWEQRTGSLRSQMGTSP